MAYKNFKSTEIIEEIGAELRKVRLSKNYTISYVASKLTESGLPISNTLLGRVENGERRIDDAALDAICAFYQVNPKTVVIAASQEHIRRLSEEIDTPSASHTDDLRSLFNNLNLEGQKEVSNLMRLMAYMEAFKK